MANFYKRKKSRWLWVKWYDEDGKPHFESTNKFVRPDGTITPCPATRDGERMAKKICDELEAVKKLRLAAKIFKPIPAKEREITIGETYERYEKLNRFKDPKTIYEHKRFYKLFTQTFPEDLPCNDITQEAIEDWLLSLRGLKSRKGKIIKQNTVFNYQKNVRKYLTYLFEKKHIKVPFLISKDVLVKQVAGAKLIFRDEDIHKVLDGLKTKNLNFRTCVYLLTFTGLRPTDIINIPVDKIDFKRKTFEYYSKKGKDFRTIPIPRQIIPILKERIKEVPSGNLLDYTHHDAINKAFSRYIKKDLKIKINYSPRTFRKSYDTWAYENGMDIVANSRLVGHNIHTAEKNYREVNIERLRSEQNKFKLPSKQREKKKCPPKQ